MDKKFIQMTPNRFIRMKPSALNCAIMCFSPGVNQTMQSSEVTDRLIYKYSPEICRIRFQNN